MNSKRKLWIQEANFKKGALKKQLGIPETENVPLTLLKKLREAKIGSIVKNPTKIGRKFITVTTLLKRRVIPAITMRCFTTPKVCKK